MQMARQHRTRLDWDSDTIWHACGPCALVSFSYWFRVARARRSPHPLLRFARSAPLRSAPLWSDRIGSDRRRCTVQYSTVYPFCSDGTAMACRPVPSHLPATNWRRRCCQCCTSERRGEAAEDSLQYSRYSPHTHSICRCEAHTCTFRDWIGLDGWLIRKNSDAYCMRLHRWRLDNSWLLLLQ